MILRRRYRIEGRVQGVGFRWFTRSAAGEVGVVGWARNEPDGSVLCEAQGTEEELDAFARAVGEGPRFSRVLRVEVVEVAVVDGERSFEIAR